MKHTICTISVLCRGNALKSFYILWEGFPTIYCAGHTYSTHTENTKRTHSSVHCLRGQRSGTTILRRPQCFELIFSTGVVQYKTYEVLQSSLCINHIFNKTVLCVLYTVYIHSDSDTSLYFTQLNQKQMNSRAAGTLYSKSCKQLFFLIGLFIKNNIQISFKAVCHFLLFLTKDWL